MVHLGNLEDLQRQLSQKSRLEDVKDIANEAQEMMDNHIIQGYSGITNSLVSNGVVHTSGSCNENVDIKLSTHDAFL